jgi:drug/metabolite transporter (DMT)-like permease
MRGAVGMAGLVGILITDFRGELAALAAAFLWAVATLAFGRAGRDVPPLELNLVKGIIACALLLLTLLPFGGLLVAIDPLLLVLLLASGAIGIGFGDTAYFESLRCLGARRALLLGILAPPLAGIIALIFLQERLHFGAWSGIAVTVAGVAWVVSERGSEGTSDQVQLARGIGFGLVAALMQASGAVISHGVLTRTEISPLPSALVRLVGGVFTLLVWIVLRRRPVGRWMRLGRSVRLWRTILFATVIGTYLGIWLQQTSLKYAEAGIAQTLLSTSPLFVLPVAAWLGERISPRAVLGALVALGGIALLFRFKSL